MEGTDGELLYFLLLPFDIIEDNPFPYWKPPPTDCICISEVRRITIDEVACDGVTFF